MTVIRNVDTQAYGSEHLAAIGLLCAIMCTVLTLRFKFNLDFSRASGMRETPAVVSAGVYTAHRNEQFVYGSTSAATHQPIKPISPAMVQLPPPVPSATQLSDPAKSSGSGNKVIPTPSPLVMVHDNTVSQNPRGGPVNRVKSTDLKITAKADTKLTKKEQKQLEQKEKERIKVQKQKDKLLIAEIVKEDAQRVEREAKLLKERTQEKKAAKGKDKRKTDKSKAAPKPKVETKPQASRPENPLAQMNPAASTDTLRSTLSNSSGPPPYSGPDRSKEQQEMTPSKTDSSGNTSFSKSVQSSGGTWDMVSQHRKQMRRPLNETATTVKVENSQYSTGDGAARPTTLEIAPPRKSLYV